MRIPPGVAAQAIEFFAAIWPGPQMPPAADENPAGTGRSSAGCQDEDLSLCETGSGLPACDNLSARSQRVSKTGTRNCG